MSQIFFARCDYCDREYKLDYELNYDFVKQCKHCEVYYCFHCEDEHDKECRIRQADYTKKG